MALTRDKKNQLVADLSSALKDAKMTAFAEYKGLTVADLQELRKEAREAGVSIKVVKNRLVRVAMQEVKELKDTDTSALKGQLVYAISSEDEVAAAQVLGKFAKTHPEMKLVGAFSNDGQAIDAETITTLSELPSKDQLIGQIVETLLSPVHAITGGLTNEDLEFRTNATN
jgi:large subunit ribosomal protein L10